MKAQVRDHGRKLSRASAAALRAKREAFFKTLRKQQGDLTEQQRLQVYRAALDRDFQEGQRRYVKEIEDNQRKYLKELEDKQKYELARLKSDINLSLADRGLKPSPGTYIIIEPSGNKLLLTEEQRRRAIDEPLLIIKDLEAKREVQEEELANLQKELATTKSSDKDKIAELNQAVKKSQEEINRIADIQRKKESDYEKNNLEAVKEMYREFEENRNKVAKFFSYKGKPDPSFQTILSFAEKNNPAKYKKYLERLRKTPIPEKAERYNKLASFSRIFKGAGINMDGVTTDQELEEILEPLEKYGFIGVFMSDEIDKIDRKLLQKEGSFVMNLDKSSGPGTHWVGVYWNLHPNFVTKYDPEEVDLDVLSKYRNSGFFYFDPFGRPPSDDFMKRIKPLIDNLTRKYNEKRAMMMDYNEDRHQDLDSSQCGFFVADWLIDMYSGVPFDKPKDLSSESP